ncbi:hypothetical protein BTJ39_02415 [Izhakiella australiensis]|uniref:Carbohydrate kinase n=1 Tax=Izhakiella australiensis TaxID=1926881 RepID=A0A1S8YT59_9GAMM|nr:FGGY family carbohydrate kinase [Izhakiella australiensis]OON42028.1 hypothetical protein BTJ39_02415 [Izhakiella australiensis]
MNGSVILTLDIGTTSCKLVLIDRHGHELFTDKTHYPLFFPAPGRVEQDPQEIWSNIKAMLQRLPTQSAHAENIAAFAISSQISAHFLVDEAGVPLTNIISWMDSRALAEAQELVGAYSKADLHHELGMDMLIGPAFIAPKLKWLAKNEAAKLAQARYLVQIKEYVIWQLSGQWRSDLTSLKGIVNQQNRRLSTRLLAWAGAPQSIIPPCGDPWDIVGGLQEEVAAELGLPQGVPLVLGWNDLNAAILGTVGVPQQKRGFDITGTSEHIGFVSSQPLSASPQGINCLPFFADVSLSYGVTSSGGQSLQWYMKNIARSDRYHEIETQVASVPAGSDRLLFLPYINGERNPWWNPNAQGVFFGLRAQHTNDHMTRAVLEGVGFALKASAVRLESMPDEFVVSGGASSLDIWNQIKADIIGVPFRKLQTTEAGCLGVAILAAYALGWHPSLAAAADSMIRTAQLYLPDAGNQRMYQQRFDTYLSLYNALTPVFDSNINQPEVVES